MKPVDVLYESFKSYFKEFRESELGQRSKKLNKEIDNFLKFVKQRNTDDEVYMYIELMYQLSTEIKKSVHQNQPKKPVPIEEEFIENELKNLVNNIGKECDSPNMKVTIRKITSNENGTHVEDLSPKPPRKDYIKQTLNMTITNDFVVLSENLYNLIYTDIYESLKMSDTKYTKDYVKIGFSGTKNEFIPIIVPEGTDIQSFTIRNNDGVCMMDDDDVKLFHIKTKGKYKSNNKRIYSVSLTDTGEFEFEERILK